ncbi:MAG: hypothetical protein ABI834_05210 [Ginsengibacter sp.]
MSEANTFSNSKTLGTKLNMLDNDAICPFSEKPSCDQVLQKDEISEINISTRIHASDLFSLFTADIIKEEVIFIR